MTTLTFDEGTGNSFKSMESTDPSWELRCNAKIYYMAFKSFLWNIWADPKPSEGRHRNIWIWEQIWHCVCISEVHLKKNWKNRCPRLPPVLNSCRVAQRLWRRSSLFFFFTLCSHFTSLLDIPLSKTAKILYPKWICKNRSCGPHVQSKGLVEIIINNYFGVFSVQ